MKRSKKNITVKDIADSLKVSASTVSRALKNSSEISQKTRELIWEKAKEMGYLPNIPVYMQKQKNQVIVFLIDSIYNISYQEIIEPAQEFLISKGYFPVIRLITEKTIPEDDFFNIIRDIDAVGIISLIDNHESSNKIYQKIKTFNLPLITVNRSSSDQSDVSILPDVYNGAFLAADHLLKRGAKKIILFSEDKKNSFQIDMENGISSAISFYSNSGFKRISYDSTNENLNYEFELLFNEITTNCAVITNNNKTARQLYHFLNSKNVRIPEDTMLVSFGNDIPKELTPSKISSIEFSNRNMGLHAAKEIHKLIKTNMPESRISIEPVKLIIRSSTMKVN